MKTHAKWIAAAALAACSMGPAMAQGEPVVFVHGYGGNSGNFSAIMSRMTASGYPASKLYGFNYSSLLVSDTASGRELASYVRNVRAQNGNAKVAIVAHSNGGLVTRSFLVNEGGQAATRRFVSLGSPHSGTTSAWACFSPACFDMRAGSLFLLGLAGRGCDRSLWSPVDGVILPASSARCGSSTQVASVDHLTLLTNQSVYNSMRVALQ